MNSIIKNRLVELNFLLFPIWILPTYFLTKNLFNSPELALIIFLIIFGESHFASTFLFYFNKINKTYIASNKIILIYIPVIIVFFYFLLGIKYFNIAVLIGAIASAIHVTRQSVGLTRLYDKKKKLFYEYLIYFSSLFFLFLGFIKFFNSEKILYQNQFFSILDNYVILIDNNIIQNKILLVLIVLMLSFISLTEKTNYKKKLINLTGVLIYSPYLFVNHIYDAMVIGVGAHWSQYLIINYKLYFYNEKINYEKMLQITFIVFYAITMGTIVYKFHMSKEFIKILVLVPLSLHMFHFFIDAFIWRFSVKEIRETIGKKLFNPN